MSNALVLTAAGNSSRMGSGAKKEYLPMSTLRDDGTISVLTQSLYAFLSTRFFSFIVITVPANGTDEARRVLSVDFRITPYFQDDSVRIEFAEGGETRQISVKNGLEVLAAIDASLRENNIEKVLIHDAARPWVSRDIIARVLDGVSANKASVPAIGAVDTQKETDKDGKIIRHLDRSRIVSVQTPQGFPFKPLLEAHRLASADGRSYTDDTEIWGRYAGDVYMCAGERENRKITFKDDL